MPANFVLLEQIELNASAASVTFSNIPQTGYTDLKVVLSIRNSASSAQSLGIKFNGSTSGYSTRWILGNGSAASSGSDTASPMAIAYDALIGDNTANTFSSVDIYIPNYTSSNYKSVSSDSVSENNATAANASMFAGLWSNTAAINSIEFLSYSGSGQAFTANSTFSLYGLAAVGTTPAIAPKASGGNVIATDGTYWYHAFLASGTFTPQTGLTCDVLVVAGGGGGGRIVSGGGGAGGLLTFASESLTAANYTVTVGAGGAGFATSGFGAGSTGSNSQFGALTTCSGGAGGSNSGAGLSGGSGSGGAGTGGTNAGGSASPSGQGNAGGTGINASGKAASGGGGGAGAVGVTGTTSLAGAGGIGATSSLIDSMGSATGYGELSGGDYYFAGGGGGGWSSAGGTISNRGAGGIGGGGAGGYTDATAALDYAGIAGSNNSGGGGGGAPNDYTGANSNTYGKNGGSGIIIVRYAI